MTLAHLNQEQSAPHELVKPRELELPLQPWVERLRLGGALDEICQTGQEYSQRQRDRGALEVAEAISDGWRVGVFEYSDSYARSSAAPYINQIIDVALGLHEEFGADAVYQGNRTKGPDKPLTTYFRNLSPAMDRWRSLVPSSAALEPLYNPQEASLPEIFDVKTGTTVGGGEIDAVARGIFSETLDGQGIRSRGEVVKKAIVEKFSEYPEGADVSLLSLASGAANIVFAGAETLKLARPDLKLSIWLADADDQALVSARQRFASSTLLANTNLQTRKMNILKKASLEDLSLQKGGGFDFIDVVGFFEYLQSSEQIATARRKPWMDETMYEGLKLKVSSSEIAAENFMKHAYRLLNEDGTLCAANMRDSHPQLAYTCDVVRWPHIVPRSLQELGSIIEKSGVGGRHTTKLILPDDGVYAVMNIHKL